MSKPVDLVPLRDVLVESTEVLGVEAEPIVLTLTEGKGFVSQIERFNKRLARADTSDYKVVRPGDIAYNPYLLWAGAIAMNREWDKAIVSPAYPVFRIGDHADPSYVLHILGSPVSRAYFDKISVGSVPRRRRAPVDDFLKLRLPLPPLTEQRRIASILDQAATIAVLRNRAVELIDAMTGSIFNERFAQLDGPAIRLEELLVDKKDAIRTGPFGSQMLVEEFVDEGVQVLGIDNVRNNVFAGGSNRHITPQKYRELERYTVLAGDVLITIMGTVGRVCVVPEGIPLSISSKHLCALTLRRDQVLPEYIQAYVLNHPRARLHLNQTQKGAIMAGLNMSIIKDLPVIVPSLSEQKRFVADLATVAAIRDQAMLHHDQIRLLTDSLATRAFNGEL